MDAYEAPRPPALSLAYPTPSQLEQARMERLRASRFLELSVFGLKLSEDLKPTRHARWALPSRRRRVLSPPILGPNVRVVPAGDANGDNFRSLSQAVIVIGLQNKRDEDLLPGRRGPKLTAREKAMRAASLRAGAVDLGFAADQQALRLHCATAPTDAMVRAWLDEVLQLEIVAIYTEKETEGAAKKKKGKAVKGMGKAKGKVKDAALPKRPVEATGDGKCVQVFGWEDAAARCIRQGSRRGG